VVAAPARRSQEIDLRLRRDARAYELRGGVRYRVVGASRGECKLPEIFVDADACPVKEETYDVALRYGIRVSLVSNSPMHVPAGLGVERVVVEQGPDAADDWIADHVQPGDVVVTADTPLAARCLAAGARVLGTNGRSFTEDSIGHQLASRELNAHLRESGMTSGGPRPIAAKDRSRFLAKLDELVQASLREERGT